jgi:hypothetical protein
MLFIFELNKVVPRNRVIIIKSCFSSSLLLLFAILFAELANKLVLPVPELP